MRARVDAKVTIGPAQRAALEPRRTLVEAGASENVNPFVRVGRDLESPHAARESTGRAEPAGAGGLAVARVPSAGCRRHSARPRPSLEEKRQRALHALNPAPPPAVCAARGG